MLSAFVRSFGALPVACLNATKIEVLYPHSCLTQISLLPLSPQEIQQGQSYQSGAGQLGGYMRTHKPQTMRTLCNSGSIDVEIMVLLTLK